MKSPVVLVTVALTVAILLTASLLIATGTRGEDARWPLGGQRAVKIVPTPPAAKLQAIGKPRQ